MKGKIIPYYLLVALLFLSGSLYSQTSDSTALDSLKHLYYANPQSSAGASYAHDIAKLYNYNNVFDSALHYTNMGIATAKKLNLKIEQALLLRTLGNIYNTKGNYSTAIATYQQALKITDTAKSKDDAGRLYNDMGTVEEEQGSFSKAYQHFNKALSLFTRTNNKREISSCYNNIGLIYHDQSNNPKAIQYSLKALSILETMNEPYLTANTLISIGNIYRDQKDDAQALDYFKQALEKQQAANSTEGIAIVNSDIGLVYMDQNDYDKALRYFNKSLTILKQIDAEGDIGDCYSYIGDAYFAMGDMKKSEENERKALEVFKSTDDQEGMSDALNDIGKIYAAEGKYPASLKIEEQALAIAKDIDSRRLIGDINSQLSEDYEKTKQPEKAFQAFKIAEAIKDSLNDIENSRKVIQSQLAHQFEKEQQAQAAAQEKKDAIASEESRRQKSLLYFVIGTLVLVILFAIFMVNRFLVIRQQKKIIVEQKDLVENKNKIIEEKNKDITDSIHYARDIQRALMPGEQEFKEKFPESFVLYMPKDIVSGDFYWMSEKDDKALFLAADCTGHGVPGALMSMIGVSLFNETVGKKDIIEPGNILKEVRKGIIDTFKQKGDTQKHRDGMDAALCSIDMKTLKAEFAGAYNPLWIIKGSSPTGIIEVAPDKQPIGVQEGQRSTFTTHDIQLEKGDTVFLFSDGYADQFGGPNGKKFKYRQFQELLLSITKQAMSEQKNILEERFKEWKGTLEQVDDVLIIGIRV
jgi:tetratricopeptide (TPR) repeat protein